MWILGLGPILLGVALTLAVIVVLFAEIAGKVIVAAAQVAWEAISPTRRRAQTTG